MKIKKLLILICCLGLYGCVSLDVVGFLKPEPPPNNDQICEGYNRIELKASGAADVLGAIHLPEYELISQSKSVVASVGEKKKGYKSWLKMVAFNEDELTATRKYLLITDERPKHLFVKPWTALRFDCEMVLETELLDKPYADENARRIAILKQVAENTRKDIQQVSQDNKTIVICGILINQGLEAVLVKLDSSPALATKLNELKGLKFEHLSLDKGKIEMVIAGDIVSVKMKLGSLAKKLKISIEKSG